MFGFFGDDTSNTVTDKKAESSSQGNPDEASTSTAANPLLNIWSVATAVTSTVKARADELVKSVVDTDWRTELSQFSREVGEESKTLKVKTAELVEHLPEQVVHLPEKAEEALQHLPEKVHLPKDVGQTLEGVSVVFAQLGKTLLQGTKELIDELKEGVETEIAAASREGKRAARGKSASASTAKLTSVTAKYNRFEAEVASMQRDSSTYCDEPEDAEDYARWRAGFSLEGVKSDISRILSDNAFMAELQSRLVPIIVEHEDFWHRYFYRLHKLQQKEEQRQQLAQRAKTLQEDDVPLGWGDDDEAQPSSPQATEGQASSTTVAVESPDAAVAPVQAEPAVAPAAEEQPRSTCEAAATSDATAEKNKGSSLSSAAMAATAVTAAVTASQAAKASVAAAASHLASEPSASVMRKSESGGGASTPGSTSLHLESEPHAETASDSSAKEWCVVSSNVQQTPLPQPATLVTPAGALPEASDGQPPESPDGPSVSEVGVEKPAVEGSLPEIAAPTPSAKSASKGLEAGTENPPEAATGARGAAKPSADAGEEELDEDWGNWD